MKFHLRLIAAFVLFWIHAGSVVAMDPGSGDTQGVIAVVKLLPVSGGVSSFQVWFESVSHDRWNCVRDTGYITVSESAPGMSADHFKRLFALALAAQVAGKRIALDSAGSNPCASAVMGWIVG